MTKPAILLLHGFRGSHLGLERVAKILREDGYKVYVPDVPPATTEDAEKSVMPREFFSPDGYADWVADYIKKHGLKKPIVIGHSMGSIIAACTAEKHPDLIDKRLILVSPISVKPPRFITNLAPLVAVLPTRAVDTITTNYLTIKRSQKKDILNMTHLCAKNMTSKKDSMRAAKFSGTYSVSDFDISKQKVCFIAGNRDRLNSKKGTKKLAQRAQADLALLSGYGHLINYECPGIVAEEIKKFIKE